MAAEQHNAPNPPAATRRKRRTARTQLRWEGLQTPPPPSNETWTAVALKELMLIRVAHMTLLDSDDAMFARFAANGEDAQTWRTLMAFSDSFLGFAEDMRARAQTFETVAARMLATIERAVLASPAFADAVEEAAKVEMERRAA